MIQRALDRGRGSPVKRFGFILAVAAVAAAVPALAEAEPSATPTEPPAAQSSDSKLSLMTLLPDLTPVSDYRAQSWRDGACAFCFGDLGARRQELYEKGVAVDFGLSQVPQGVVSGGTDRKWEYGGSADYYLFLDSGRLGLWPGALVGIHAESKFGDSVNSIAGSVSPVNADFLWPDPTENSTFLSEYYVWQGLTDWLAVMGGRVNWTALADRNRFANDEKTQFLNMSLRNTLLLGAFVPQSAHGAMAAITPTPNVSMVVVAISANDVGGVYGSPGGLFDEVTAGAEIDVSWELAGLPGAIRPGFIWTSKDPVAVDNPFLVPDLILGLVLPTKSDNWIVNLNLDQYLYMPEKKAAAKLHTAPFDFEPEGIGVFFRYAYAPEDRNPWNQFLSVGIGGRGVIPTRSYDRYGVGFYALFESGDLKRQPIIGGALSTEWGMEAYYNLAITPWLQFSPSIQYIESGLPGVDDSVVIATRLQLYF